MHDLQWRLKHVHKLFRLHRWGDTPTIGEWEYRNRKGVESTSRVFSQVLLHYVYMKHRWLAEVIPSHGGFVVVLIGRVE